MRNLFAQHGMPLRTRLILSSLLVAIPLTLLGIILLVDNFHARRDLILANNLETARLTAVYLEGWVDGEISTLRTLANSNEVRSGDVGEIQGLIDRQVEVQSVWENLFVTNAAGQEYTSYKRSRVNVSQRDYFQRAKATGKPAVSDLLTSLVTGNQIIVIVYPISLQGQFGGVVGAAIPVAEFQEIFARVPLNRDSILGLWDSDGRLIAGSNVTTTYTGRQYDREQYAALRQAGTGTTITIGPLAGERVLLGYAEVPVTPWLATVATPYATALAPVYRPVILFTILSLLLILASVSWAIYSANVLSAQFARLADSARAIGAGDFTTRVDLPVGGEIEDLATSLNKMANDLAVLDRLKSDLLSMVSHGLKTPLTTVRTFLDVLASGVLTPDDPRYKDLLTSATRQARRLQDMIENLLSVARLEAGGLGMAARPSPLAPIIAASVQLYENVIRAKGLALTLQVPPDLLVMADAPKVTLAVNNLLDNAVKYTEQGGITVAAIARDSEAVITVTDTGEGFTPEVQAQLFQKFVQHEPLLTRRMGGAGLGLVVVKAIVEGLGGRVFAESAGPGQGSTFGFTLPLADAACADDHRTCQPPFAFRQRGENAPENTQH